MNPGRTPGSDPPGFVHSLILDTCYLGDEEFGADTDRLCEAVLASQRVRGRGGWVVEQPGHPPFNL